MSILWLLGAAVIGAVVLALFIGAALYGVILLAKWRWWRREKQRDRK